MPFGKQRLRHVFENASRITYLIRAETGKLHFPRAQVYLPEHRRTLPKGRARAQLGKAQLLFPLLYFSNVGNDADDAAASLASGQSGAARVAPLHATVRRGGAVRMVELPVRFGSRPDRGYKPGSVLGKNHGEDAAPRVAYLLFGTLKGLKGARACVGYFYLAAGVDVADDHRALKIFEERAQMDGA